MNYLLRDDLERRGIKFSNKHLIHMERHGRFPRRVRLGHSSVAWIETEVDDWQARLAAERDSTPSAA
jgi:prophage regulatory protein